MGEQRIPNLVGRRHPDGTREHDLVQEDPERRPMWAPSWPCDGIDDSMPLDPLVRSAAKLWEAEAVYWQERWRILRHYYAQQGRWKHELDRYCDALETDRARAIEAEQGWAESAVFCHRLWLDASSRADAAEDRVEELERELEGTKDGVAYWRHRFVELNGDAEY